MLYLLVSIRFQVLFHSPPGVLFTFPSRYYTLSVTRSYLALGDGPPFFRPGSTCPAVLWIPATHFSCFAYKTITFFGQTFQFSSTTLYADFASPNPFTYRYARFRLFPFRSPLLRKSIVFFLFLRVLRCFSSPSSPH